MAIKLLTGHNLEFLSLKGGCTGSSESTLVKIPHCWKALVTAHIYLAKAYIPVVSRLKLYKFCDLVTAYQVALGWGICHPL